MTALTPGSLRGRSMLREADLTRDEFLGLVGLARELKAAKAQGSEKQYLQGRNVAAVFEKTSTRTRAAVEVSCFDQGAHVTYLDPSSSQIGHKESAADTARVLSRFYDAIMHRGSTHSVTEELAEHATVPVHNMLTNDWHPTQMLADVMTMLEHTSSGDIGDVSYCYLGDARNNVGNSLLVTGALLGIDVRIGAPTALQPSTQVRALAESLAASSGARLTVSDDLDAVLPGAGFVHTDVWVSMGEPAQTWDDRVAMLGGYRVDTAVMERTGRTDSKFMHCLPALHDMSTTVGREIGERTGLTNGIEVAHEVFESSASIVFDQAENRMHTIKALLVATVA
jgi:ornithine carbamoyltransferase